MKRPVELPDIFVFVLLAATFAIGYFLPTPDMRFGFALGWLASILGFVAVELRFLNDKESR